MIYISWKAYEAEQELERQKRAGQESGVALLSQSLDLAQKIWTSWATTSMGKTVSAQDLGGMICVPPHKIVELKAIKEKYQASIGFHVACGASPTMEGAQVACQNSQLQMGQICISQDEVPLAKASPGIRKQPGSFAYMHAGEDQYSPGDADAAQQDPAARGYIPLSVHKEKDFSAINMLRHFRAHANKAVAQEAPPISLDEAKEKLLQILTEVKGQTAALAQLKQDNPAAYGSIVNLLQGVMALTNAVQAPAEQQPSDLKKYDLPFPKAKRRHGLTLPVGTVNDTGPSGTRRGGKIRVQHGDGHIGWSSGRWGLVTAQKDVGAPIVTGTVSHPASSKKPSGT